MFRFLAFCFFMLSGCQAPSEVPFPPVSSPPDFNPSIPSLSSEQPYTLAILPFENVSLQSHVDWLTRGLQEMLVSDLARWPHLEVVSREALGPVLREQWLQQQGFSSSANPVNLGRLKGVRYLIQGRLYARKEQITVDLQIVDVETGVVVSSATVHGLESDIPKLEQELVTQIVQLFDSGLNRATPSKFRATTEQESTLLQGPALTPNKEEKPQSFQFLPLQSLQLMDAYLALETLTHERREAHRLAELIWQKGWSIEIGSRFYQIWTRAGPTLKSVTIMNLPVSILFSPQRLEELLANELHRGAYSGIRITSDGFQLFLNGDSGANQLFVEYFHKPRRVFIRALNAQGDVLAVFSHWTWRTERKVSMPQAHNISLPMWPEPFLSGLAQFPLDWIEGEGDQVTFDAGIFPVPEERVSIMLEPVDVPDHDEKVDAGQSDQQEAILQKIKKVIGSQWEPAITEGLPTPGYLPGNKRTAVGRLQIQDGIITQARFQRWPQEPLFSKSLQELQSKLIGLSLDGKPTASSGMSTLPHSVTNLRLQLTLRKDLHALRLGSPSK